MTTQDWPAYLPRVPRSVVHELGDAAACFGQQPALCFEGERLNYAQYAGLVGAVAARLAPRVRPGDRVALVMQNSLDLAVALFAVHALRAQAVPLNPGYTTRELGFMLQDAAPVAVLHDRSTTIDLPTLLPDLDPAACWLTGSGHGLLSLLGEAGELPADLPSHGELATLQYTGGTTGLPKGVNITHGQLAHNLAQREAWLPTRQGQEVVLCVMPLFHVSAAAMSLHLSVYARAELVIHRRFQAHALCEAVQAHRVTLLSAAPAIFHDLLAEPTLAATDLSSLRACFSGAAPLPREVLGRFEAATGCVIHEGYGMSEAGPCLTYNPMHRPRKAGTVGLPVPGGELQVVDLEHGLATVPVDEPGEIRVRGPHVMAGYRNLPDQTAQVLRGGWLYTGDVASQDAEGYVRIHGRKHDTINVGGFKVYPAEVEQVLRSHADVSDAAAFAVPDDRLGQVVQAWVVPRPGCRPDMAALLAHCATQLTPYKQPRRIGLATQLPRTSVGKLARNQLQPVGADAASALTPP